MAVPGQIQLTVVPMNNRVPLPRASESNRMRFSAAQGRESDHGQCLNPGHNVINNPLWIALTAPGRWVSDLFRRPPSMRTDSAAR
jgi:hypothetical protein